MCDVTTMVSRDCSDGIGSFSFRLFPSHLFQSPWDLFWKRAVSLRLEHPKNNLVSTLDRITVYLLLFDSELRLEAVCREKERCCRNIFVQLSVWSSSSFDTSSFAATSFIRRAIHSYWVSVFAGMPANSYRRESQKGIFSIVITSYRQRLFLCPCLLNNYCIFSPMIVDFDSIHSSGRQL